MSSPGSVTYWLDQLKEGDAAEAAQKLWECYFQRLVELARQKLHGSRRREADEEDVALSALDSFFNGVGKGRFPNLEDRNNLWRLLVVITARKALDQVTRERRAKRGGGGLLGESALQSQPDDAHRGIQDIIGREPTPEFAAQVAEECRALLDLLPDADLRSIALWKMEGYTNQEIATKLGCAVATVERRLRLIRKIWQQEGEG